MLRMNRHLASAGTSFLVGGLAPPKNMLTQHGNAALRRGGFGNLAAVPAGYGRPGYGLAPCDTTGGISSFTLCLGTGSATASPAAGIGITGAASGSGDASAAISGLALGTGSASGAAVISGSMMALGIVAGESSGVATVSGNIFAAVAITGTAAGSSTVYGDGYLAVSLSGQADGSATVYGSAAALVNTSGTASGSGTASADIVGAYFASGATAGVGSALGENPVGLGWAVGAASGACTATLEPFALGFMAGTTDVQTELTADGITAAVLGAIAVDFNVPGTIGNKINTASAGGVDLNALADAVWSADEATYLTDSAEFIAKIATNKRAIVHEASGWALVVYDDDGTTPILQKALKDKTGGAIADLAAGVLAQEEASTV